jgi:hypothetical protein
MAWHGMDSEMHSFAQEYYGQKLSSRLVMHQARQSVAVAAHAHSLFCQGLSKYRLAGWLATAQATAAVIAGIRVSSKNTCTFVQL